MVVEGEAAGPSPSPRLSRLSACPVSSCGSMRISPVSLSLSHAPHGQHYTASKNEYIRREAREKREKRPGRKRGKAIVDPFSLCVPALPPAPPNPSLLPRPFHHLPSRDPDFSVQEELSLVRRPSSSV